MAGQNETIALSLEEAAKTMSVGKSTLYKLIKAGRLPIFKLGKRTLVKYSDLELLAETSTYSNSKPAEVA